MAQVSKVVFISLFLFSFISFAAEPVVIVHPGNVSVAISNTDGFVGTAAIELSSPGHRTVLVCRDTSPIMIKGLEEKIVRKLSEAVALGKMVALKESFYCPGAVKITDLDTNR